MDQQIVSSLKLDRLLSEPKLDFPRGVAPKILLNHVKNTAPFVFYDSFCAGPNHRYLKILRHIDHWLEKFPETQLDHAHYFELCVAAHWGTVATFVPTDVDNQIRSKLWHPALPLETLFAMVDLVEEALSWDSTQVSTRWVKSPISQNFLSGHHGEWFSIAVAAYGALRSRHPERAEFLSNAILNELNRQLTVFNEYRTVKDGIGSLKAATIVAHNAGDLVRVMDMWSFDSDDRLRKGYQEIESSNHMNGAFSVLSFLNKQYMAVENHRNFALRKPKCLRHQPSLLLPLGPFFDDWGKQVAQNPELSEFELGEITEALFDGWVYLENTVGYARALAGMEMGIQGGLSQLCKLVPSKMAKQLSSGKLRTLTSTSQNRFENQWNQFGLKLL